MPDLPACDRCGVPSPVHARASFTDQPGDSGDWRLCHRCADALDDWLNAPAAPETATMPDPTPRPSVEQMCRALLTEAVRTELVSLAPDVWADPLPSSRTAGDLCGMANLLTTYLRGEHAAGRTVTATAHPIGRLPPMPYPLEPDAPAPDPGREAEARQAWAGQVMSMVETARQAHAHDPGRAFHWLAAAIEHMTARP